MKSVKQWVRIFQQVDGPAGMANRVLAELQGYRQTSLHRATDGDDLIRAMEAYRILQNHRVAAAMLDSGL